MKGLSLIPGLTYMARGGTCHTIYNLDIYKKAWLDVFGNAWDYRGNSVAGDPFLDLFKVVSTPKFRKRKKIELEDGCTYISHGGIEYGPLKEVLLAYTENEDTRRFVSQDNLMWFSDGSFLVNKSPSIHDLVRKIRAKK